MNVIHIKDTLLEAFMVEAFEKLGIPSGEARIIAEVLITADRRGIDSHGIGRFKPIYYDRIKRGILNPVTRIEVIKETGTTAVLDGHDGMGHVISHKAMSMAVEKAGKEGLGMVAVRNSSHYGIAGYYATMATARGMIGITGTNARPSIAPTFGVENMLGTNPLTVGIPTDEAFDFVLDCATSISQRGKIEKLARDGQPTPEGWVIDREGRARTDTAGILEDLVKGRAALTPLGGIGEELAGYKGFGYAVIVEILSAALQDGRFLKDISETDEEGRPRPYHLGHFFIAIDVSRFIEEGIFRKIAGTILRDLRASEKMPGQERIYTAGEKEYLAWQERKDTGIPVGEVLLGQMREVQRELGMSEYDFLK